MQEKPKTEISNYASLPLVKKIETIVKYARNYVVKYHKFKDVVFLFDKNATTYMVPIDDHKFLTKPEYKRLFNDIMISIVDEVQYKYNTSITNVLYIYVNVFDTTAVEKVNLDIPWEEDLDRRNSMIVIIESQFNHDISIYDCISIVDEKTYTIVSEKPIKKLNLSKLDADHLVSGFLTNILK